MLMNNGFNGPKLAKALYR